MSNAAEETPIATYPSLKGKTVVVTGGGSGIGAAIVRRFVEQGVNTGFIDIAEAASKDLARKLDGPGRRLHFELADLRDIEALRAAIAAIRARFGPIDILINNAAHDERHATPDVTPEYFDERIAVNLKHQFFAAQAVLPDMVAKNQGVIINFGSTSWLLGRGNMPVYTAAKAAVLGFTRSIARDYGKYNIRCLAIAPGWTMTERQLSLWLTPEGEQELMNGQCLKRKLTPDDIARVTLFFASDEAGVMTNQQYVADGGWL
ncbi:MAG TPA: SDR family oxidoreductase [Roseiarcus sp.]|nr:SDR family oxidoreductase [Roseiarcus sp.]